MKTITGAAADGEAAPPRTGPMAILRRIAPWGSWVHIAGMLTYVTVLDGEVELAAVVPGLDCPGPHDDGPGGGPGRSHPAQVLLGPGYIECCCREYARNAVCCHTRVVETILSIPDPEGHCDSS